MTFAPLTAEEVADTERLTESVGGLPKQLALRLIADLRASDAEVERLAEQNDGLYQATLMLSREVDRWKAEVERLRTEVEALKNAGRCNLTHITSYRVDL